MRAGRTRVRVAVGAVAASTADVLVRTCSSSLLDRGDPVLEAAGPEVREALRRHRRRNGRLVESGVLTTPAGALAAGWLVHVAVPRWTVPADHGHRLAAAYRAVIGTADGLGARTLAMPALGTTGPYWPLEELARIGIGTLASTPSGLRDVQLLVSTAAALEALAEAMARESSTPPA